MTFQGIRDAGRDRCPDCGLIEATEAPLFDRLPTHCYAKIQGRSRRAERHCLMRTIRHLRASLADAMNIIRKAYGIGDGAAMTESEKARALELAKMIGTAPCARCGKPECNGIHYMGPGLIQTSAHHFEASC